MNIQKYRKKEIAFQQLATALELFFADKDLFSVITLAGSAEELLGQLLPEQPGRKRSLRSLLKIIRPGKSAAADRQGISWQEAEDAIHMDPYHEAVFLLERAIDDYQQLSGGLTDAMRRFNREFRRNKSAAYLTRAPSTSRP